MICIVGYCRLSEWTSRTCAVYVRTATLSMDSHRRQHYYAHIVVMSHRRRQCAKQRAHQRKCLRHRLRRIYEVLTFCHVEGLYWGLSCGLSTSENAFYGDSWLSAALPSLFLSASFLSFALILLTVLHATLCFQNYAKSIQTSACRCA